MLEGDDSMSIAFKGGLGALADAGLGIRDVDGVVGAVRQRLRVPGRASARCGVTSSWSGIPAILEAATAIASGLATTVLVLAGTAGVYTDRASTAPWTRPTQRVRGAVRHVHRGRVRARGASPHAPLRHQARRAGHRRRHDPQQRARATPRRDLPRARPVHAAGHPRQPHGRRPVPPPRLRDRRRRAAAGWCSPAPTSPADLPQATRSTCSAATATASARRTRTRRRGSSAATVAPDLVERHRRPPRRGGLLPHRRARARPTSTCASSTTRSRSRSSASSRRSASAARARAATS